MFIINPLLNAPVENSDMVHIRLFLLDALSLLCYCQKVLYSDPSSRLLALMKNSHDFQRNLAFQMVVQSWGRRAPTHASLGVGDGMLGIF